MVKIIDSVESPDELADKLTEKFGSHVRKRKPKRRVPNNNVKKTEKTK